jgi:hypothetical protein
MKNTAVRSARWLAPALVALASLGCAAAWILLALASGRQSSWMAVVAAFDAAILLRIARAPAGAARACTGVLATLATIVLANWGIAAGEMGRSFGMLPWDAAVRMGPHYAWQLGELANGGADRAWLAIALVVAAAGSR